MKTSLFMVLVSIVVLLTANFALAQDKNEEPRKKITRERFEFEAQTVKLNESIKNDISALPGQGEVNKPQEDVMGDEPIRPDGRKSSPRQKNIIESSQKKKMVMKVSAYCVVPRGAKNYRKKVVRNGTGITYCGKRATIGTVSADLRHYPLGTVFDIPGYGRGIVQDCGGGIKGKRHIDVFMSSYQEAIRWGVPSLRVRVKLPGSNE